MISLLIVKHQSKKDDSKLPAAAKVRMAQSAIQSTKRANNGPQYQRINILWPTAVRALERKHEDSDTPPLDISGYRFSGSATATGFNASRVRCAYVQIWTQSVCLFYFLSRLAKKTKKQQVSEFLNALMRFDDFQIDKICFRVLKSGFYRSKLSKGLMMEFILQARRVLMMHDNFN